MNRILKDSDVTISKINGNPNYLYRIVHNDGSAFLAKRYQPVNKAVSSSNDLTTKNEVLLEFIDVKLE
ncbi:MAG: hypothetical protein R3E32_24100 [Chitinophagales bacterium]